MEDETTEYLSTDLKNWLCAPMWCVYQPEIMREMWIQ